MKSCKQRNERIITKIYSSSLQTGVAWITFELSCLPSYHSVLPIETIISLSVLVFVFFIWINSTPRRRCLWPRLVLNIFMFTFFVSLLIWINPLAFIFWIFMFTKLPSGFSHPGHYSLNWARSCDETLILFFSVSKQILLQIFISHFQITTWHRLVTLCSSQRRIDDNLAKQEPHTFRSLQSLPRSRAIKVDIVNYAKLWWIPCVSVFAKVISYVYKTASSQYKGNICLEHSRKSDALQEKKNIFSLHHQKEEIHSFPAMNNTWGASLDRNGSE